MARIISLPVPEDIYQEMGAAVDYPDEFPTDWIRDAIRLRLELENDRELIEKEAR